MAISIINRRKGDRIGSHWIGKVGNCAREQVQPTMPRQRCGKCGMGFVGYNARVVSNRMKAHDKRCSGDFRLELLRRQHRRFEARQKERTGRR